MKVRPLLLAVVLLCAGVPDVSSQQPTKSVADEVEQLREQVQSFMHFLLNREKYLESFSHFSESAFHNPGLISASCVGILPADRKVTPNARKEGAKRFLEAFHKELAFATQAEAAPALSTDTLERWDVESEFEGLTVANDLRRDKYVLASLSRESIVSVIYPDERERKERKFLFDALKESPLYLNLVVVKSGDSEVALLLVWKEESGTWKIVHIDMLCA